MDNDQYVSDPVRRVLGRLGLLEIGDVGQVAADTMAALGPAHATQIARLLVASLDAHHRSMIRRIAMEVGRGVGDFAELRAGVGLGPRTV